MTEVAVLGIWYQHTDFAIEDHVKLLAQVPYKSRQVHIRYTQADNYHYIGQVFNKSYLLKIKFQITYRIRTRCQGGSRPHS